jgi:hypothetical protein
MSAGLSAGKIIISGVPVTTGLFAGNITICDAAGAKVAKTFSIRINPPPVIGTFTANQWTVGEPGFPGTMTIGGGTGSFTLSHAGGLPAGLTAIVTGHTITFTGTPNAVGTFTCNITVQDAVGSTVTKAVVITIHALPTISNLTATQWTAAHTSLAGTMTISGGTGPFTIAAVKSLPAGVVPVVKGRTISFTGPATEAGTFDAASITIADSARASITKVFSITVNP